MGIVRNSIDILGITPEEELPRGICGQLIETSETEHIHMRKAAKVKRIYQITIDIKIIGTRMIHTPLNRIVVLDCLKTFMIAYYDETDQKRTLECKSPFNCFIDIENKEDELEEVEINLVDAYFDMLNSNTMYSHILYIINIKYCSCMKCSVISKRKKAFQVIPFKNSDYATDPDWTKATTAPTTTAVASAAAPMLVSAPMPTNVDKYYEITFTKEALEEIGIATQNEVGKVNELIDLEAEYL